MRTVLPLASRVGERFGDEKDAHVLLSDIDIAFIEDHWKIAERRGIDWRLVEYRLARGTAHIERFPTAMV